MSMQSMMNSLVRKAVLSAFLATLFASPQTLSGTPGSVVRISWNESGFPGRQYTYPFRAGVNHFSSDNRYVVFSSDASNLVDDENGGVSDIFVYDVFLDKIEIISRANAKEGVLGEQGNGASYFPSISADGRFVAFQSYSTNFTDGDTDALADIFVYDRQMNSIELVSRSNTVNGVPGPKANKISAMPVISANGRYVAFQSYATNLVANDTDNNWDIYVYDRQTELIELVSKSGRLVEGSETKGNKFSTGAAVSGDGRYIAFQSAADNLVDDVPDGKTHIYVFDRMTDTIELISRSSSTLGEDGEKANDSSAAVSISNDGRYIAFRSSASNLVNGLMDGYQQIFVYDRQQKQTELISRASSMNGELGELAVGHNYEPSISANGRYVSFRSHASNLIQGENSVYGHVFVYDRQTTMITLASASPEGTHADSGSLYSSINSDGNLVMFSSYAQNLAGPQPYRQVFIKQLPLSDFSESNTDRTQVVDAPHNIDSDAIADDHKPSDENKDVPYS